MIPEAYLSVGGHDMAGDPKAFFAEHGTIGGVALETHIRLARTRMSAGELAEAKEAGYVEAAMLEPAELLVGDAVVARGTIVHEDGNAVFQVEEVL